MEQFLRECDLEEAIELFSYHEMTVKQLDELDKEDIKELFPKFGQRLKFIKGLRERANQDDGKRASSDNDVMPHPKRTRTASEASVASASTIVKKTAKRSQLIKESTSTNEDKSKKLKMLKLLTDERLVALLYEKGTNVLINAKIFSIDKGFHSGVNVVDGWKLIDFNEGGLVCPLCLGFNNLQYRAGRHSWNVGNFKRHLSRHKDDETYDEIQPTLLLEVLMNELESEHANQSVCYPISSCLSSMGPNPSIKEQSQQLDATSTETDGIVLSPMVGSNDDSRTVDGSICLPEMRQASTETECHETEDDHCKYDDSELSTGLNSQNSIEASDLSKMTPQILEPKETLSKTDAVVLSQTVEMPHSNVEPICLSVMGQASTETECHETEDDHCKSLHSQNSIEASDLSKNVQPRETLAETDAVVLPQTVEMPHSNVDLEVNKDVISGPSTENINPGVVSQTQGLDGTSNDIHSQGNDVGTPQWKMAGVKFGWVKSGTKGQYVPGFVFQNMDCRCITSLGELSSHPFTVNEFKEDIPKYRKKGNLRRLQKFNKNNGTSFQ